MHAKATATAMIIALSLAVAGCGASRTPSNSARPSAAKISAKKVAKHHKAAHRTKTPAQYRAEVGAVCTQMQGLTGELAKIKRERGGQIKKTHTLFKFLYPYVRKITAVTPPSSYGPGVKMHEALTKYAAGLSKAEHKIGSLRNPTQLDAAVTPLAPLSLAVSTTMKNVKAPGCVNTSTTG
ncbi:MAG: hypothetical protein J2O48_12170 [Solirubrobacterales bacterium]|nr:hypothetical protein [Solirubrobacterales bacterium]